MPEFRVKRPSLRKTIGLLWVLVTVLVFSQLVYVLIEISRPDGLGVSAYLGSIIFQIEAGALALLCGLSQLLHWRWAPGISLGIALSTATYMIFYIPLGEILGAWLIVPFAIFLLCVATLYLVRKMCDGEQ